MIKNYIQGRVIIPYNDIGDSQMNREAYIQYCHNNNKVMISSQDSGSFWVYGVFSLIQNKTDGILCDIDFPTPPDIHGSVIYAYKVENEQGYECFCIRNSHNQFILDEENLIRLLQTSSKDNSLAGINIRGLKGILEFFAESGKTPAQINIKTNGTDSQINFKTDLMSLVMKQLNLTTSDSMEFVIKDLTKDKNITSLKYTKGSGLSFIDEFGNSITQDNSTLKMVHKKAVEIGSNSIEKTVKGETLNKTLSDFFDQLFTFYSSLTVIATSLGSPTTTPANAPAFKIYLESVKVKLINHLSNYLKIE